MNNVIGWKTTNRGAEWTGTGIGGEWEMQFLKEENIGYSAGTGLRIYKTENGYENWQRLVINDNFSDVFFTNEEKGFALGNILYRTTDGGNDWEENGPGGSCVYFINSTTGFIGNPGGIWKTTDAGENWYTTNGSNGASKIFFINETTGWATRDNIIFKTTDGGENWFNQFAALSSIRFQSIYFVDSLYGWTANSNGRPYKTIDGGDNWLQQTNLNIGQSRDVYFKDVNTGWIIDHSSWSALRKTTDGGLSWNELPEIIGAFSFHFFPNQLHWIINGSHDYITEDGGLSFFDITNEVPSSFNSFSAPFDYIGYAVGSLGLILKYEDTTYVTAPEFTVSENTINFGEVEIGTTNTDSILISNTGSGSLEAAEIISSNQDFTFSPDEFILPESEEIYLTISFTPKDTSVHLGFIIIKHNGLSSPDTIIVEGKGDIVVTLEDEQKIPAEYKLDQNYPNPFNSSTVINYQIPQKDFVNISLYDIKGEKIFELLNEEKEQGEYTVTFENIKLPSGIYFLR
ncbi:MAG TPA: T9SS type A sorting domain-containing protein, partial [Bacteroidia bacterium]|nr:T9SS type A sorting domain-containing protein [Bacteroidia bacterium]